ncbi:class I SAM-dependent methyltransferase [Saccharopolyspora oryzae]|uniref:Class I SAM-dependent methyltransferase n=1 Tax=Saccharopolyspora oryzae TaxID=2997343 RepID=A0ABT4UX34_9PSEU|nr:class I SAM-dependent methyltransferase [Saccharopolyspora oryzae]MDA3626239.1 class I SAM-dependent methyltransferase [Saccharopolyspora oryzae]
MIPETPLGAGPTGHEQTPLSTPDRLQGASVGASPLHVLRFLAATLRAKAVVEVGTGSGESALWLLRGMVPDGLLTSIDADASVQRVARATLREAGVPAGRTRLIAGRAIELMPRLTAGGYDLISVNIATTDYPQYLELGLRLLRPGGVIVFAGIQLAGPDPASAMAQAVRALVREVQSDDGLVPVTLATGPGLLAVTKRA